MSAIQNGALIRFVTLYLKALEQITDQSWGQTGDRENNINICLIGKCYWCSVSIGYYLCEIDIKKQLMFVQIYMDIVMYCILIH